MYGQGAKQTKSREKEKESSRSIMAVNSIMSEEEIIARLKVLEDDPTMKSESVYSPTATAWPDSRLPFIESHLVYLRAHKNVNPEHYISNLALMIKKR